MATKVVGFRINKSTGRPYYAAQKPGDGGVDWGYTNDPNSKHDPAIHLSPYWVRRFAKNARLCNDRAYFSIWEIPE
jgi:hypothetical protein